MQRKKKEKIYFRKIGGGSFRTKSGRIIKPNQQFRAFPEDIPDAFKDTIIPVDPVEEAEFSEPEENTPSPVYRIVFRSRGWADIVNEDGKRINEKSMRVKEAEKMLADLMEGNEAGE